ncbi:variable surface protein [Plasmodium gonderi]|uniref:Variable surface protein n=1 Tax=Plasmodium gonderi TaxID=77519 RepID=A0A1Y1JR68_PLAGO|nr:variable surface protein [Plasmodium gonderi]GAW83978.1 variable surface protein [Plasmodium gonderi]
MSADQILIAIKDKCKNKCDNKQNLFDELDNLLEKNSCKQKCIVPDNNMLTDNDLKKFYDFLYNNVYFIHEYNEDECSYLRQWIDKKKKYYEDNVSTKNDMDLWDKNINIIYQELCKLSNCFFGNCCKWGDAVSACEYSLSAEKLLTFRSPISYIFYVCFTLLITINVMLFNISKIKRFFCNKRSKVVKRKNIHGNQTFRNNKDFKSGVERKRINIIYQSKNSK